MKKTFRLSMTWLHTWAGLVLSWILFLMFLTGTLGYLDTEIDRWMQPEIVSKKVSTEQAVKVSLDYAKREMPEAKLWDIMIPNDRNYAFLWLSLLPKNTKESAISVMLDPESDDVVTPRETAGGRTLYRMHYALHYMPRIVATYIVGVATMMMFVAIVTGIIIHKKIFRDFFTFRPGKGPMSWLDAHNLLSVSALPFHLMITYSGLLFFTLTYMPGVPAFHFGIDDKAQDTFFDQVYKRVEKPEAANTPAPLVDINKILDDINQQWGEDQIRFIEIYHPGDANAEVHVARIKTSPTQIFQPRVYSGVTGEWLATGGQNPSGALIFDRVMANLHEGLFAGPALRALYLFTGLVGTIMIGSGLILWVHKRRSRELASPDGPSRGYRLVEGLNLGTVIGLPCAIGVFFLANRLLPIEMENRAAWEMHCLFITWVAFIAHAFLRAEVQVRRKSWIDQLWFGAGIFAALPVVNSLTTERDFLTSLNNQDWLFAGFDLGFISTALCFAGLAFYLNKHQAREESNTESNKLPTLTESNYDSASTVEAQA